MAKTKIIYDLDAPIYRAQDGISKSSLDDFAICPAYYKARKDGLVENEESPAMSYGTLVHSVLLDGGADYYEKPEGMNFATKEGKAWKAEHADKQIVSAEMAATLAATETAVNNHPHAAMILRNGKCEVSMFGVHRETGLPIKGRADFIGQGYIADIKTTRDASNRAISSDIKKRRYHVQAAMYLELARQNGIGADKFYFVFIQSGAIPLINVRQISAAAIERGTEILNKQLFDLKNCMEKNVWPDYSGDTAKPGEIDLPEYAYLDLTNAEKFEMPDETETENHDLIP